MEISPKVRTNAVIAYFFLGPLMLLSRGNPNFSDAFVRSHARTATRTMLAYAALLVGHWMFLSDLLDFKLPLVAFTASRGVSVALFALFVFALVRGANRARLGLEPAAVSELPAFRFSTSDLPDSFAARSETEKILALWSFVPVLGIVFALRSPSREAVLGMRAGSVAFLLYALLSVSTADASLMALSLAYAAFFVTAGVSLLTSGTVPAAGTLAMVPSLESAYRAARTVPAFVFETFRVAFGKKHELSFGSTYRRIAEKDAATESAMDAAFPETGFPIPPEVSAVPGANLILAPRLFSASPYRYAIAAGQGVALTALFALFAVLWGFDNPYQIFLLPAVALLL